MKLVTTSNFGSIQCDFYQANDNQIWLTRRQIGEALEYEDPSHAIKNIHLRHKDRLDNFSRVAQIETPFGIQSTTVYSAKGVYEICRWSQQPKADDFYDWVYELLERLRTNQLGIAQKFQPWAELAGEHLKYAKLITESTGVKPGIAFAAAIAQAEKETGRDLSAYQKLLPAAEHETAHLTPTDIAKQLGMSAVKFNKLLAEIGLIKRHQDEKGRKYWRITEQGKEFGEEFPYVRNGHSGYQIKWNKTVLNKLPTGTE